MRTGKRRSDSMIISFELADRVDTKKKELIGDFRNNGREYRPQGSPQEVRVHDFLIKELGRAVPYGVYNLAANAGVGECRQMPAPRMKSSPRARAWACRRSAPSSRCT